MRNQILEIIAKSANLDIELLDNQEHSRELWDSFTKVDIVLNLESSLKIEFSDEDMVKMNSLSEILSVIELKMS